MTWFNRLAPQVHVVGSVRQWYPWNDAKRTLHDHEILFFDHGFSGQVIWDEGVVDVEGGTWILIPPGLPHVCRGSGSDGPWRGWVHFDWSFVDDTFPLPVMTYAPARPPAGRIRRTPAWVPHRGITVGRIEGLALIRDLHARLAVAWNHGDTRERHAARGLALEILAQTLIPAGGPERQASQVLAMRVRDAVDRLAAQPFSRSDALRTCLAALGRSADHCSRAFRQVFGVSPARYLAMQRIQCAEGLLISGLSPSATARALGFTDLGYFTRLFRLRTGLAPGRWRQRHLAGSP